MHKYHRKQGTEFHHHKNQGRAHRFWTSVPVAAEKEGAHQVKSLRQHKIPGQPPPLAKHHSKNQAPRSLLPQLLSVSTHRCRNSSPAAQAAHCMSTSTGSKAGPSSCSTRRCSPSTCGDVVLTLCTHSKNQAPRSLLPQLLSVSTHRCRNSSPAAQAAHCMSTSTGSKAGPSSSTTRRCSPSTCGDVVLTLSTPGTKGAPAYLPTHLLCFRRFCRSISPAARAAQAA